MYQFGISFIIPMRSSDSSVKEAISSILEMDEVFISRKLDYEVLVIIDDTHDSLATEIIVFLNEFISNKEKKIRLLFVGARTGGASEPRNCGITNAKHEWLFFLDSDDTINLTDFKKLICEIDDDHSVILSQSRKLFEESLGTIQKSSFKTFDLEFIYAVRSYLYQPNRDLIFSHVWGHLFRVSVIRDNRLKFNRGLTNFEDVDFLFKFFALDTQVKITNLSPIFKQTKPIGHSETVNFRRSFASHLGFLGAWNSIESYLETSSAGMQLGESACVLELIREINSVRCAFIGSLFSWSIVMNSPRYAGNYRGLMQMKNEIRLALSNNPVLVEVFKDYEPIRAAGGSRLLKLLINNNLFLACVLAKARYRKRSRRQDSWFAVSKVLH